MNETTNEQQAALAAKLETALLPMWSAVLPLLQPQADAGGYGVEWREMCEKRTAAASLAARVAVMFADTQAARKAAQVAQAAAAVAALTNAAVKRSARGETKLADIALARAEAWAADVVRLVEAQ